MHSGDVTLLLGCEPFLSTAEGGEEKKLMVHVFQLLLQMGRTNPSVSGGWGSPPAPTGMYQSNLSL